MLTRRQATAREFLFIGYRQQFYRKIRRWSIGRTVNWRQRMKRMTTEERTGHEGNQIRLPSRPLESKI
jgi:hypothetical protein